MQKNFLLKTGFILAILLIFLFGIVGVPKAFTKEGFKQAVLDRIHLGLDLKGGVHLILQVMVDEAVNTETDNVMAQLKEQMQKEGIAYTDMSKPDPGHPETIVIKGVPVDAGSKLRAYVTDYLRQYTISSGADGSTIV